LVQFAENWIICFREQNWVPTCWHGIICQTGWLGIRIMCQSEATCLSTDLFQ
jgi:hypothetical protein